MSNVSGALREHSVALVCVSNFLKEHKIDKKASSHKYSLHLNIHIQRELNTEVVCVGKDFLQQTSPLLTDPTNRLPSAILAFELKVNVSTAVAGHAGPLKLHHSLLVGSHDGEFGVTGVPVLLYVAYGGSRRGLNLHLLQAAGAPAGHAAVRSDQSYDLSVHIVFDLHVKAAQGTTAVACAAVIFLFGGVDLLTQTVLDLVLVVGLEANECLQQLHFLMNKDLVNLSEVLQTRWYSSRHCYWCRYSCRHSVRLTRLRSWTNWTRLIHDWLIWNWLVPYLESCWWCILPRISITSHWIGWHGVSTRL